jgi:hypothetical protein
MDAALSGWMTEIRHAASRTVQAHEMGEWSAQFRATKGSQLVTFLVTSAKTSIPPGY